MRPSFLVVTLSSFLLMVFSCSEGPLDSTQSGAGGGRVRGGGGSGSQLGPKEQEEPRNDSVSDEAYGWDGMGAASPFLEPACPDSLSSPSRGCTLDDAPGGRQGFFKLQSGENATTPKSTLLARCPLADDLTQPAAHALYIRNRCDPAVPRSPQAVDVVLRGEGFDCCYSLCMAICPR